MRPLPNEQRISSGIPVYRNISHFANLTPLRFLAAWLVVLFHVEETRKMFGAANLTHFSLFTHGPLAVTFFFVLSGFLITYLLLREWEHAGQIDVPRFYVRRILRIWPLYLLMVFTGLVVIPAAAKLGRVPYESPYNPWQVAPYFLLFVPFVVNLMHGNHFLTPLWSIGVEEMYYLSWAPLVKWFRKHLVKIMLGTVLIKVTLALWFDRYWQNAVAQEVLRMLQFEAMAIGGLAAYLVFHRDQPLHSSWLFSRPTQVLFILPLVTLLIAHRAVADAVPLYAALFDHHLLTPWLMMCLFGWFIANAAVNEHSILRLNWPLWNYLGDISYGIYMYHALAISLLYVPLIEEYRAVPFWAETLLVHAGVAAATLLFAGLSKRFFENRFLRYKARFEPLRTGLSTSPLRSVADKGRQNLAA